MRHIRNARHFWHRAAHIALSGFTEASVLVVLCTETQGIKENPTGPAGDFQQH